MKSLFVCLLMVEFFVALLGIPVATGWAIEVSVIVAAILYVSMRSNAESLLGRHKQLGGRMERSQDLLVSGSPSEVFKKIGAAIERSGFGIIEVSDEENVQMVCTAENGDCLIFYPISVASHSSGKVLVSIGVQHEYPVFSNYARYYVGHYRLLALLKNFFEEEEKSL